MTRYLAVFILSWCTPFTLVEAAIVDLTANLDCSQASAGAGTCAAGGSGTGSALMTLDTGTNEFSWDLMWSGTSGTVSAAHFHGPASPNQNAGVQVAIDISSNPTAGSNFISAPQAADLLSGLWYINIHTDAFGPGEIRGQVNVVPVPAAVWLFGTALIGFVGMSRRRKVA
jgi:hypothetical protein